MTIDETISALIEAVRENTAKLDEVKCMLGQNPVDTSTEAKLRKAEAEAKPEAKAKPKAGKKPTNKDLREAAALFIEKGSNKDEDLLRRDIIEILCQHHSGVQTVRAVDKDAVADFMADLEYLSGLGELQENDQELQFVWDYEKSLESR